MATSQPNILLITSDQQHWTTLGVLNPAIKTPNLDRLAAMGTTFERAYCPNPTCTPTRASLITGLYPSQHGAYALGTKLPEDCPTLPGQLQAAGYDCALIGKAHFQPLRSTEEHTSLESYPLLRDLDFWREFKDDFYGFNHVELARNHADEAHVGQHYALWMEEKGLTDWRKHFVNHWAEFDFSDGGERQDFQEHTWSIPEEYHYNTWIAERSIARIDADVAAGKPFFLWSSFFDPHPPYLVPKPWDTMYDPAEIDVPALVPGEHDANPPHFGATQQEKPDFGDWREEGGDHVHGYESHLRDRDLLAKDIAIYYGMVSCMDKYIGKILDHLEAKGLLENTLVVFTSDHGHLFGQHGMTAKGPFHYEDLIRVPMIAAWPGRIPAGQRSSQLQSLVDLPPSFMAAAGVAPHPPMTGRDQLPCWEKGATVRDAALVENRHQPTTVFLNTLVTDRHKITAYAGHEYGELFDLQEDPDEVRNLWNDPASRDLKVKLLLRLQSELLLKDPVPMPRICGA